MPFWHVIGSEFGIIAAVALALGAITVMVVSRLLPPNVARLQARGRVGGLVRALRHDKSARVRRDAALALGSVLARDGKRGKRRAVEPLMAALSDPADEVRRQALLSLAALGDERSLPPLLEALSHPDEVLRVVAADALGRIGSPDAIEPLTAAMDDESELVRRSATAALITIGSASVEPLCEALSSESRHVFFQATRALAIMGDQIGRASWRGRV